MLDFLDGIYQYQANTSTSRNTTKSTTRSTTVSTSNTVDTTTNTTISTTASTTRSTTTTFDTTFSTTVSTSFNTSYTTSYSTSIPVTREPSSGWYQDGNYFWDSMFNVYAKWAGTVVIDINNTPSNSDATSATGYDGKTYLRGPLVNSDIALKTEIAPARNYLDTVNGIPVHTFKYKTNVEDDPVLGVMAQEVEAVAPELMTEKANGVKAVYPQQIQYAMLKAIQELTSKVEDLENKIKSM